VRGDLSLRYSEPGDKWWVNGYVQNVSDKKTRTSAGRFQMADGSLQYVSQYLAPRTYGVQVGVWF
jgi:iron complex outermembrane receptor protein